MTGRLHRGRLSGGFDPARQIYPANRYMMESEQIMKLKAENSKLCAEILNLRQSIDWRAPKTEKSIELVPRVTLDSALDEVFECKQMIQELQISQQGLIPKSALIHAEQEIQELRSEVSHMKNAVDTIIPKACLLLNRIQANNEHTETKHKLESAIKKLEEEQTVVAKLRSLLGSMERDHLNDRSEIEHLRQQQHALHAKIESLTTSKISAELHVRAYESSIVGAIDRLEGVVEICGKIAVRLHERENSHIRRKADFSGRSSGIIGHGFHDRRPHRDEEKKPHFQQNQYVSNLKANTDMRAAASVVSELTVNDDKNASVSHIAGPESIPCHMIQQKNLRWQGNGPDQSAIRVEKSSAAQSQHYLTEQSAASDYAADLALERAIALELAYRIPPAPAEPSLWRVPPAERARLHREHAQAVDAAPGSAVPVARRSESVLRYGDPLPSLQRFQDSRAAMVSGERRRSASVTSHRLRWDGDDADFDNARNRLIWR